MATAPGRRGGRVTDTGGLSTISTVDLTVSRAFTSIVVSPAAANLYGGQAQQLSASGREQFGDALTVRPSFSWSTTARGVATGGLYTAPITNATFELAHTPMSPPGRRCCGSASNAANRPLDPIGNPVPRF